MGAGGEITAEEVGGETVPTPTIRLWRPWPEGDMDGAPSAPRNTHTDKRVLGKTVSAPCTSSHPSVLPRLRLEGGRVAFAPPAGRSVAPAVERPERLLQRRLDQAGGHDEVPDARQRLFGGDGRTRVSCSQLAVGTLHRNSKAGHESADHSLR